MASAADNEHLQITIDTLIERLSAAQRNYRNLQAQCEQERKTWAAQRETYETRLRSFQSIETTVDEQARTLQAQERRIHELESRLAVERESDANLQRKEKSPLKGSDELREGTKAALPNQAARQQACRTLEPLSKVPPTHIPQPTTKALPPSALTLAQAATRPASVPATPSPSATLSRSASSAGITVEPLLSGRVQGALMPAPHLSSPPLTSPPACMPSSDEVACPPSRPAATVPAAPCKTSSPGSTRNPSATSAWDNGLDRLQMNLSKFSDRRLFARRLVNELHRDAALLLHALIGLEQPPPFITTLDFGEAVETLLYRNLDDTHLLGNSSAEQGALFPYAEVVVRRGGVAIRDHPRLQPPLTPVTELPAVVPEVQLAECMMPIERHLTLLLWVLAWRHMADESLYIFLNWVTERVAIQYGQYNNEHKDLQFVCSLVRIFTALCRLTHNAQRVRLFCHQLLQAPNPRAGRIVPVVSNVVAVWSEPLDYAIVATDSADPEPQLSPRVTLGLYLDLLQAVLATVHLNAGKDDTALLDERVTELLYSRLILYCGWRNPYLVGTPQEVWEALCTRQQLLLASRDRLDLDPTTYRPIIEGKH